VGLRLILVTYDKIPNKPKLAFKQEESTLDKMHRSVICLVSPDILYDHCSLLKNNWGKKTPNR